MKFKIEFWSAVHHEFRPVFVDGIVEDTDAATAALTWFQMRQAVGCTPDLKLRLRVSPADEPQEFDYEPPSVPGSVRRVA